QLRTLMALPTLERIFAQLAVEQDTAAVSRDIADLIRAGARPMSKRQFRILYREFLFRIVDRELLSTHATGDMSQLLLQGITLLAFLSLCFSVPALFVDFDGPVQVRLMFAWSVEHFLIATTMLAVGVFAVLSWGSMFPDHRDVLVLAPLPIRAHTLLLAKLAGVA